jgi:hypothetical protein
MAGIPFNPSGAPSGNYGLGLPFSVGDTPAAASGIPGLGNLAVNGAVRPTNSFGTQNFTSVMSHYVSISNPDRSDAESVQNCRDLGLGMLVFVRETDPVIVGSHNDRRRVRARYDGVHVGPNTVEMKELTMLNQYLKAHSADYPTASSVMAEWRLLGVVKAEAAPTNYAYGSGRVSRVLNLVVSHRVSMFNYWVSSRVLQTQKLHILVTKDPTNAYWQLEPWTSPNADVPRLSDLVHPKSGDIGEFYYVGKSSDSVWAHVSAYCKTNTTMTDAFDPTP